MCVTVYVCVFGCGCVRLCRVHAYGVIVCVRVCVCACVHVHVCVHVASCCTRYGSYLVVRASDASKSVLDFRGARVAYNDKQSLSG